MQRRRSLRDSTPTTSRRSPCESPRCCASPQRLPPVRLVDAATLARILDVDRDWVYAHARELQAVRLGGERGRLRFDLALVFRSLKRGRRCSTRRCLHASVATRVDVGGELLPIDP